MVGNRWIYHPERCAPSPLFSLPPLHNTDLALAIFFCLLVFNYFRQTLDPSSPGNVTRDPQRVFGLTPQYRPPFGPPPDRSDYYNYPGPSVPPPHDGYDNKPPGYTREGFEGYDDLHKDDDKTQGNPQDGSGSRGERDVTSPNTARR